MTTHMHKRLPFTVLEVHHQLRRHPDFLDGLAETYGTDSETLRLIESQPAERIEVWERDAAQTIPDWNNIEIAGQLYAETVNA